MPTPRTGFAARLSSHLTDADLIGRYVADRDEAAFAALVARHGPAVLGVCRQVLGNPADADDAFQATFLVLARKAHRVTFRRDVAGWLFAVAVRCSRELLRRRTRRAARETVTAAPPDLPAPPARADEAGPAVLAEVARLGEAYRAAVVLCELEGRSRADAAARLGVPEGTLSSRLAAARRTLARRLAARGLAPAAVAGLAVPPAALAARAVGVATASVVPSERVTELTEAVMRTGIGLKAKVLGAAAAVLLAAVGLAAGGEKPAKMTEPAPPPADDSRLLVRVLPTPVFTASGPIPVGGVVPAGLTGPVIPAALFQPADAPPTGSVIGVHRLTPDGREGRPTVLNTPDRRPMLGHTVQIGAAMFPGSVVPLASDGRRIAYLTHKPLPLIDPTDPKFLKEPLPLADDQFTPKGGYLHPLDGGPPVPLPTDMWVRCFSRDGRHVYAQRSKPVPSWANKLVYTTVRLDAATGKEEPVPFPADAVPQDTFPDGRFLAVVEHPHLIADSRQLAVVTPGNPPAVRVLTPKTLCGIAAARVSPDGAKVAYLVTDQTDGLMPDPKEHEFGLFVLDVATAKVTRLPHPFARGVWWHGVGLAWSPDGKRLAYSVNVPDAPGTDPKVSGGRVVVCDADGGNAHTHRVGPPIPGVGMHPFVHLLAWR